MLAVQLFGPDHKKVVPLVAFSCRLSPSQRGLFDVGMIVSDPPVATMVVPVVVQPAAEVATTVYVPASAEVTGDIMGLGAVLVNELGPVQLHEMPPVTERVNVPPIQTGLFDETEITGTGFTITSVVATELQPRALVTVTVYVPAFAGRAIEMPGLGLVDTKLFGPVQL